jgi:acetyl esterase/lipase
MPDPAAPDAVIRDAGEMESAFAHPAVRPDVTAAYGEHPDQVIDFYAPRGGQHHVPLVVLLHGGVWRTKYDRTHVTPFADFLARRGFAVANVEYRRGNDGTHAGRWPETFDALPAADAARTVVAGHSAGGHLALWAAARHVLPVGSPWRLPAPPPLRGVVALAPIADLARADELGVCGGAVRQLLGDTLEFKQRMASADPAALLPTGIATAVVHGRRDLTVPQAVPEAFVEAAAKAGETVGWTLLEDVGHFPLIDPSADACAVVAEEIAQLAW